MPRKAAIRPPSEAQPALYLSNPEATAEKRDAGISIPRPALHEEYGTSVELFPWMVFYSP